MNTVRMMKQVLLHPYDFYHDIQEPGRLKWHQGIVLILLVFVARMLSIVLTSFTFQTREPYEISYVYEFVWIVVPWLSWSISNWGVSAILDGEGKFKEVLVGSAFAAVPYILFIVPISILTNLLSLSEQSMYTTLTVLTFVWVAWLLLAKVKIVHDFELGKLLFITLISLLGIAIIWFIGILMYGLINQFINFIVDLVKEIRFRM
ncbi:Yip1 family protein [Paenibacillus alkalitolerans]|uniref:Yip1 family protein n=1 Tax=Paenibacillus alkalitolerans TaxID=2799335 RepID=UPI0018F37EBE|nr:Yip1 family protein [Paenibacillus alkalitolerans]